MTKAAPTTVTAKERTALRTSPVIVLKAVESIGVINGAMIDGADDDGRGVLKDAAGRDD